MTLLDISNLELLNRIDEFYNSAWTKLVVAGAIVVVVVPLLIQYFATAYQRRTSKQSEEMLEKKITDRVNMVREEMLGYIKSNIENLIEDETKDLGLEIYTADNKSRGDVSHIWGCNHLDNV
jgi:hypothetical protein